MSRRRSRRCCSFRAPANSSIRTTSHVARSALSSSPTRMHAGDPVSRRYSTQADVSTRIIAASPHFVQVAVPTGSAHPLGFLKAERFRCERSQRKIDGFPLGRQAVPPHDRCAGFVVDIHVGACHTSMIHKRDVGHGSNGCAGSLADLRWRQPVVQDPDPSIDGVLGPLTSGCELERQLDRRRGRRRRPHRLDGRGHVLVSERPHPSSTASWPGPAVAYFTGFARLELDSYMSNK